MIKLAVEFIDPGAEAVGVATERDVQVLEEAVTAREEGFRCICASFLGGLAVEDDDPVGEVGRHYEVVLDDEGGLLCVHDEALDDAGGDDTLFGVEIGGGLVDQVDVCGDPEGENDGDTLQFSARQVLDFLVDEVVELEGLVHVGLELRVQEAGLNFLEEELADRALEFGRDLLRFHADVHAGDGAGAIRLLSAGEHTAESRLACAVLAHHDDDLGVREAACFDAEVETAEGFSHGGIAVCGALFG